MRKALLISFTLIFFACLAYGADPAGTWKMTADAPDGNIYKFDLTIKNENGKLTGTAGNADLGTLKLDEVEFAGNQLSFKVMYEPVGPITFKLRLDGDTLKGTLVTPDGDSGTVAGNR